MKEGMGDIMSKLNSSTEKAREIFYLDFKYGTKKLNLVLIYIICRSLQRRLPAHRRRLELFSWTWITWWRSS